MAQAPVNYGQAFSLIRLADLLGVDGYLTLMAGNLDVPVQRLTNNKSKYKTYRLHTQAMCLRELPK